MVETPTPDPTTPLAIETAPTNGERVVNLLKKYKDPEVLILAGIPTSIVAAVFLVVNGVKYDADSANAHFNAAVARQSEKPFNNKGGTEEEQTLEAISALENTVFESGQIAKMYIFAADTLKANCEEHETIGNIEIKHPATGETRTAIVRINDPVKGGIEGVITDGEGGENVFLDDNPDLSGNKLRVRVSLKWNGDDSPESDREENIWAALALEGALKKVQNIKLPSQSD